MNSQSEWSDGKKEMKRLQGEFRSDEEFVFRAISFLVCYGRFKENHDVIFLGRVA